MSESTQKSGGFSIDLSFKVKIYSVPIEGYFDHVTGAGEPPSGAELDGGFILDLFFDGNLIASIEDSDVWGEIALDRLDEQDGVLSKGKAFDLLNVDDANSANEAVDYLHELLEADDPKGMYGYDSWEKAVKAALSEYFPNGENDVQIHDLTWLPAIFDK